MLGSFQLPWIVVEGGIITGCPAEMDWLSVLDCYRETVE